MRGASVPRPGFRLSSYTVDRVLHSPESQLPATDIDLPQCVAESFGLPFTPSLEDTCIVRRICRAVTTRAAAYVAVAVYSMRNLQVISRDIDNNGDILKVSCLGSVVEKYPGFMGKSQGYLDQLQQVARASGSQTRPLQLQACPDSSLTGVAVAALLGKSPRAPATTSAKMSSPPRGESSGGKSLPPCCVVGKMTENTIESMSHDSGIPEDPPKERRDIWAWFRRLVGCRVPA